MYLTFTFHSTKNLFDADLFVTDNILQSQIKIPSKGIIVKLFISSLWV